MTYPTSLFLLFSFFFSFWEKANIKKNPPPSLLGEAESVAHGKFSDPGPLL